MKTIRQIFIEYLDTHELVYEYLRDNQHIYKRDSEGEYSLEDERDVVDILIEGIVDTMNVSDFFDILEGEVDPELEYFFLDQDVELFKQFKYAILTDPELKKLISRVGVSDDT